MKKVLSLASIALLFAFLFSGCSSAIYQLHSTTANETRVELSRANFKVIKQVQGTAITSKVFGIGGLSRRAIEENAYANMLTDAGLTGSQVIINVTFDDKYRGFPPFYVRRQVTAHGLVIEFFEPEQTPAPDRRRPRERP